MKVRNGKQLIRKLKECERTGVNIEITVKTGHRWARTRATITADFAQKSLLFIGGMGDAHRSMLAQAPSGDALSALIKVYNAR